MLALWIAALAGLPQWLGAHPWWAVRTGIVGSAIGAAVYLALRMNRRTDGHILTAAAIGLVASILCAGIGKMVFVGSLAENALAGRFWFFGWFAIFACLCILLTFLIRRRFGR